MKTIKRTIEPQIEELIGKNKVILVLGTRRVGKTFLVNAIQKKYGKPISRGGKK